MEILILGGILVAAMVYVSTKIKRSAARAFERETIETDKFSIVKPEGFISPINENSEYAFEAYSKDFGTSDETEKLRQAQAVLKIIDNFETNEKPFTGESETLENGVAVQMFHKILENENSSKIYKLEISVLKEYREAYLAKINEMLDSFSLKQS